MAKRRRVHTEEHKRQVLQYARLFGRAAALRKYKLASSLFAKWKTRMGENHKGIEPIHVSELAGLSNLEVATIAALSLDGKSPELAKKYAKELMQRIENAIPKTAK